MWTMFGPACASALALGFHLTAPAPLAFPPATSHRLTPLFPCSDSRTTAGRAQFPAGSSITPLSTQVLPTPSAKSFPCTSFQKTLGGWGPLLFLRSRRRGSFPRSLFLTAASYLAWTFFCTFLQFFAFCKITSHLFSIESTLFAQNTGGWGYLATRHLPLATSSSRTRLTAL
jgi:hypothetical protein